MKALSDARALRRFLYGVLATASASSTSGCCFILTEDRVPGSDHSFVVAAPPEWAARVDSASYLLSKDCEAICGASGEQVESCFLARVTGEASTDTAVVVCNGWSRPSCSSHQTNFVGGRVSPAGTRDTNASSWLLTMAAAEASSIGAFDVLARELASLGAPQRFVRRARLARLDEVRHARAIARLARGERPPRARPARSIRKAPRERAAILTENLTDGCVMETFGALVALAQAERAADPRVRRTMAAVAADELRHAALAWAIAGWAQGGALDDAARATLRAALRVLAERPPYLDDAAVRALGAPSGAAHTMLVRALERALQQRGFV
ncbi:MAG: ferritin-like domain-containing protein [Polyangiaceae bacterium]